ncbi:MAG: sodium:solute symporter [Planctomycetota bacterium]
MAVVFFTPVDWCVLVAYFVGILMVAAVFWRRNQSVDQFSAGGRSLPGWLCGLSIFATYLSSVSYLALPGKAFAENWNPLVFSLALPLAAWVAVRHFVPLYRNSQEVSAYAWMESRFGLWARVLASCFYILYQIARMGVVMYLMALPMAILFAWDIRAIIVLTGLVVTAYSFVGGITAVIWADAIQAVVLLAGAILALAVIAFEIPGGAFEIVRVARAENKVSLGSTDVFDVANPTVWVVLAFGFFDNLRNFGVDQSYVQRYVTAKSDRDAARSVWIGSLLYVPVSLLFLVIGTSLYAAYQKDTTAMEELRTIVAEQRLEQEGVSVEDAGYVAQRDLITAGLTDADIGDRVFPHFIASRLPQGMRGLLIAAVFAAAMSTVSTSLNSSATLVMSDFYVRLRKPDAPDGLRMRVLRMATVAWGGMGTAMALVLAKLTDSVLDTWWLLSGVLGAVIIGLLLLGLVVPRLSGRRSVIVVGVGLCVIAWMTLSNSVAWPASLAWGASPFHPLLTIVIGPLVMLAVGRLISNQQDREHAPSAN